MATDRACTDYALFAQWTEQKAWFVTRMKESAVYRFRSKMDGSLSKRVALLRGNRFAYRDLRDGPDDPYHTPPLEPGPLQPAGFGPPVG